MVILNVYEFCINMMKHLVKLYNTTVCNIKLGILSPTPGWEGAKEKSEGHSKLIYSN